MSLKDWGLPSFKPFATRHGGATGHANERKMADAIGGTDSTRTVLRNHPDGSTTMLRTRNGFPEYTTLNVARPPQALSAMFLAVATMTARFNSLYMTSGAYAFGAMGGINISSPLLTVEPVTYKHTALTAIEAAQLVPFYDRLPPNNGEVSKIYNQTAMPGGLNAPKTTMLASRPSEFSGLMRRCMQARYGAGNTSQNMCREEDGGTVLVGSTFSRTTGIVKFQYGYYFIAIESGGGGMFGRWWPLLFPPEHAALYNGSITEAQETLALSGAYVMDWMEMDLGNFDIAQGAPIAYGWNFSLTGHQAVCVTHDANYGYDRQQRSLMTLTFSLDVPTLTLSCGYALTETVDGWMISARSPIWSPVGGSTLWWNKHATSPDPDSDQDMPLYAYFIGDALKVVRWKWISEDVTYSQVVWEDLVNTAGWATSVYGAGTASMNAVYNTGSTQAHGFTIDGSPIQVTTDAYKEDKRTLTMWYVDQPSEPDLSIDGIVGRSDPSYYSTYYNPCGQYSNYNPYAYPTGFTNPPPAATGFGYTTCRTGGSAQNFDLVWDTGAKNHLSALVIPANDCCACYIGEAQHRSGTRQIGEERNMQVAHSWVNEHLIVLQGDWTTWDRGRLCATAYLQCTCIVAKGTPNGPGYTNTTTTEQYAEDNYNIRLYRDEFTSVGVVPSEIFTPSALHDTLSQQVCVVSSSLYHDARYASGNLISEVDTTNSYPLDITLFVGAS